MRVLLGAGLTVSLACAIIAGVGVLGAAWPAHGSTAGRSAAQLPPLPVLAQDAFPEPSRAAIAAALRFAQERPSDAEAAGALGMRLHAWLQLDHAAAAYRRAQALAPDVPDWWYLGGIVDTALGAPAAAARQFATAKALATSHQDLLSLRLADAHLAAGADDQAASLYRPLTSASAHAASAWYGLGRIALRRHDDAAARESLERAIALSPEFGAAHYALAQVLRRAGDTTAATVALARHQQCAACMPFVDDPWQARVTTLRDDAFARLTRGIAAGAATGGEALTEAIRLHEAALARPETRGLAHTNLIELHRRAGDLERAKRHYLAALDEPGSEAEAHRQYAAALLDRQQAAEALRLFEQATALAPRDAAAWQGRGLALEQLGRAAEAVNAYESALRIAPDAHQARFGLARLAMRAGQVDQAIAYLEALRSPVRAETPRYLFALATAWLRLGRDEDARRTATEALDLARSLGDVQMAAYIDGEIRKLKVTR